MSPQKRAYTLLGIAGLVLSLAISVVVFSSKKDLSVQPSEAATIATSPTTIIPTPTETAVPTLLRPKNQDVPLKVLGSIDTSSKELSYLYTELTSKGIISNVTSNSASILWLTEAPQQTQLKFGINDSQLSRKYSNSAATYIHEAKLEKLSANTLYYYTGHAPIIDTFTTPAALLSNQNTGKKVLGTIKEGTGTCIVRASFTRGELSSAYATITTTNNTWGFVFDKLRTSDYTEYFNPQNTDTVEIDVLCVNSGKILYTGSKKFTFAALLSNTAEVRVYREN